MDLEGIKERANNDYYANWDDHWDLIHEVERLNKALKDVYNNRFDHNKIQDIVEEVRV